MGRGAPRIDRAIRVGRRESTGRFAAGAANRQSDSWRGGRIDKAIQVGRLESTKRREPAGPNRYTDSNRKRNTFRIFVRFRSADLSLFLVRIGRPELKNNSAGKRSKSARIDKVILDRRELKIDSSRWAPVATQISTFIWAKTGGGRIHLDKVYPPFVFLPNVFRKAIKRFTGLADYASIIFNLCMSCYARN